MVITLRHLVATPRTRPCLANRQGARVDCFSDPFNRVERVLLACLRPGRTPEVGVRTKHTNKILDSLNASSVNELANATLYPANVIAPYSSISPIGWHTVDGWVLAP